MADPSADTVREHITKTVNASAAVRKAAADAAAGAVSPVEPTPGGRPGPDAGGRRG